MRFWSSVGSLISSAVSAVSSIAGSIGNALASAAKMVLNVAGPWLSPVCNIVISVARMLGVLTGKDDPEALGMKAEMADRKPEDFDSIQEYIDYLRNEIRLDREQMERASAEKRTAYRAVGVSIAMKGINEKKGFEIPTEAWVAFAKAGLEGKEREINALLTRFRGEQMEDFIGYVEGGLTPKKELEVGERLVEIYRELEPELSEAEIERRVMQLEHPRGMDGQTFQGT